MKKYIIYTLKRYIPLYAVTFAICFSTFLTFFSNTPVSYNVYEGGYHYSGLLSLFGGNDVSSGLMMIAIMFAVLTMILPLFANTYRYSIKGADIFYQVGKGKKSIRFVNNLVLLAAATISFTVAFVFGIGVLLLRQIPNIGRAPEVITETYGSYATTYTKYYVVYNFIYYLPAYLLILAMGIINYFISYFFVTRANNFLNSMITLVLGEIILGIGLMTPFWYITIVGNVANPDNFTNFISDLFAGTRTASVVGPIVWIQMMFDGLITGFNSGLSSYFPVEYYGDDVFALVLSIIGLLCFLGMGALGIKFFLKEPESSGELCGKPQGRGILQIIIFHITFGLIGLWSNVLSGITSSVVVGANIILVISQGTIFGAIYYVFIGLIRRNFRLNLKELLILISTAATDVMLGITIAAMVTTRIS